MAEPFWTRVLQNQDEGEPSAGENESAASQPENALPSPSAPTPSEVLHQSPPDLHVVSTEEPTQSVAEPASDKPGDDSDTARAYREDSSLPFAQQDSEEELPYQPYRPAKLPEDFHKIEVNKSKFNNDAEEAPDSVYTGSEDVQDISQAHIDDILRLAMERKASDIHITVGLPPMVRIDGTVHPLPFNVVTAQESQRLLYDTFSDEQLQKFEQTHELDFSYGVSGLARFRVNVYVQRGSIGAALRAIPTKIPAFEDLGLPNVIRDMCHRTSGLILVTGPTGSGKSTTIATMLSDINATMSGHIMTIEDPIEYLHTHKKCIVNQREMHSDTYSFHNALRAVLREDPDIILVGELRDLETIEAALTLAETGHLVFGTLHTRNAPATIDRVVDVFPSDQQAQIRVLLGNTLEGVISQQLLPRLGGGRSAAIEIMLGVPAIKNLIREGKTHQMYSIIETNQQMGMQTMDRALADLYRTGMCAYEECLMRAVDKESFARLAKGG